MHSGHWLVLAVLTMAAGCGDSGDNTRPATGAHGSGTAGDNSAGDPTSGVGAPNSSTNGSNCPTSSPGALFANALCVCGDLGDVGNLIVDGNGAGSSDSIGVDGMSTLVNHLDVGGSYSAYGGLADAGYTVVHYDLMSAMDVDVAGNLEVTHDLALGGSLRGLGRVAVGGALRIAGADQMLGWQQSGSRGAFTPLAAPPCPCDAASLFDVDGAVAAAKANAATVILSTGASGTLGVSDLNLQAGAYYLADAATIGYAKLHISGAVSLYVDGTIDDIGADRLVLASGATLDLYVTGGVNTVGYAGVGDASSPSSFRLYVGGAAPVTLSVGAQWFHGSIYAPRANIAYVGDTHVAGGLFAHALVGTGQLVIGGDLPGSPAGGACPPSPPDQPPVTPTPPVTLPPPVS